MRDKKNLGKKPRYKCERPVLVSSEKLGEKSGAGRLVNFDGRGEEFGSKPNLIHSNYTLVIEP